MCNTKWSFKVTIRQALLAMLALVMTLPISSAEAATAPAPAERVVQATGDFPRTTVVAPSADGKTMALYLVEGSKATQILSFNGTTTDDQITCQPSPDGKHVGCLIIGSEYGNSILDIVDVPNAQQFTLGAGIGKLSQENGAAFEKITSLVWTDDQHVLYSKVTWPSTQQNIAQAIKGEIWLSNIVTNEQHLLATAPIYRVLGASQNGQTLYVTRLIPGAEEWHMEGFALLDVTSGKTENLWPAEQNASPSYYDFKLVTLPNGKSRILFMDGKQGPGLTVLAHPPIIWMGDPETRQTQAIWTIAHGTSYNVKGHSGTYYDLPSDIRWSPLSESKFIYSLAGSAWQVSLDNAQEENLGTAGPHLLAWTSKGLVSQNRGTVYLLNETNSTHTEIRLSTDREIASQSSLATVPNTVVNWPVPYVHQLWDTPDWFMGYGACGPTSAVMALAYYSRLPAHSLNISVPAPHTNDYGWYVTTDSKDCTQAGTCAGYTQVSACQGTNTFDQAVKNYFDTHFVSGAFGATTDGNYAYYGWIQTYLEKHDVGQTLKTGSDLSETAIKADLDGGAVVILGTMLTKAGHIIVVRGYTSDGYYIVNDPRGKNLGSQDDYDGCNDPNNYDCGAQVLYTWPQMRTDGQWYIPVYGPQYLPDLKRSSNWDSSINILNNSQRPGSAKICFMNTSGALSTPVLSSGSIPAHGTGRTWLSSSFNNFNGMAVVVPQQTGMRTVAINDRGNKADSYVGIPAAPYNLGIGIGTQVFEPNYMSNYYGWSSNLYIQNTGPAGTTAKAYLYNDTGGQVDARSAFIPANGEVSIPLSGLTIGSVRVQADQPLAVTVRHDSSGDSMEYEGVVSGGTAAYMPSLMKNYYGWNSDYEIQEITGNSGNISTSYYPSGGTSFGLSGWAHHSVYLGSQSLPDNWLGSGKSLVNSGGSKIVMAIHLSNSTGAIGYLGLTAGARDLVLPYVKKNVNGWDGSLTVQNMDNANAQVTISFYNLSGGLVPTSTFGPVTITPGSTQMLYSQIPSGFEGSVVVHSNGANVNAVVHQNNGRAYGYNAVP